MSDLPVGLLLNDARIADIETDLCPDISLHNLQLQNALRASKWGNVPWTRADWVVEFIGEFGEACNKIKKLKRIESGMAGNKPHETVQWLREQIALELGDAMICLALLANESEVNLTVATRHAFNTKSEEVGFPERL